MLAAFMWVKAVEVVGRFCDHNDAGPLFRLLLLVGLLATPLALIGWVRERLGLTKK